MSMELCVLASGSMGNCSVVRTLGGVMLIDLGIGPRVAARRLNGTGVNIRDIGAVCLTHLDRDHFSPNWVATLLKLQIPFHCHAGCVERIVNLAGDSAIADLVRPFEAEPFEVLPHLHARPLGLAHDADGSHGFLLDGFGSRLGYATDLGHVPAHLLDCFCDLDVLAIESNYDARMQMDSGRPWFLKQRIMGGRGHLSNQQAFDAIRAVLDRCQKRGSALPRHIVLLHRSRDCNCPQLLRKFFSRDARIAPRLVLAEQFHRTEWLAAADRNPLAGEQLLLAWG